MSGKDTMDILIILSTWVLHRKNTYFLIVELRTYTAVQKFAISTIFCLMLTKIYLIKNS